MPGSVSLTAPGQTASQVTTPFGSVSNSTLVGRLTQDGNAQALSGFSAVLWLVSGPGPTYTNEVALCQFTGPGQIRSTSGTWQRLQPLPVAGRPWNIATDACRLVANGNHNATSGTVSVHLAFSVCDENVTGTDCCAETLAKLDEILSFVSRTWPVVPPA